MFYMYVLGYSLQNQITCTMKTGYKININKQSHKMQENHKSDLVNNWQGSMKSLKNLEDISVKLLSFSDSYSQKINH